MKSHNKSNLYLFGDHILDEKQYKSVLMLFKVLYLLDIVDRDQLMHLVMQMKPFFV